jgi:tRNA splicing ligase
MELEIKDSISFLEIFFARLTRSSSDIKAVEDSLIDVKIKTGEVTEEIQLAIL